MVAAAVEIYTLVESSAAAVTTTGFQAAVTYTKAFHNLHRASHTWRGTGCRGTSAAGD